MHLRELIDSVLAQTDSRWCLLARDDGSTDGGRELLEELASLDARIEIVDHGAAHLGTCASFSRLLECAVGRGADWVALCDQDDVWLPGKLAAHRSRLAALSADPSDCWLLHSDLAVVGRDLAPVHTSLLGYMGIRHQDANALETLLVQNFVTGCSALASRGLLEIALPVAPDAVMHDWWLALCAAAGGRIAFDPTAHVQYRQHAANQVGAKGYRASLLRLLGRTLSTRRHSPDELLATVDQAAALASRLRERTADSTSSPALLRARDLVSEYVALFDANVGRWRRVRGLRRLGVGRQDRIRDAALKLKLLTTALQRLGTGPPTSVSSGRSGEPVSAHPAAGESHSVEQVGDSRL